MRLLGPLGLKDKGPVASNGHIRCCLFRPRLFVSVCLNWALLFFFVLFFVPLFLVFVRFPVCAVACCVLQFEVLHVAAYGPSST